VKESVFAQTFFAVFALHKKEIRTFSAFGWVSGDSGLVIGSLFERMRDPGKNVGAGIFLS